MKTQRLFIPFLLLLCTALIGLGQEKAQPGQEKGAQKRLCPFCKTTGKIPNPFYEGVAHLEDQVKFCSWVIEKDKKGLGIPWIPCENCRNADLKARAEEAFEKEVAIRRVWLAKRREVDTKLKVKKPLLHLETEHFVWAWDIPKMKVEKKTYRMHEALHLYAQRMEDFYAEFQRIHGISDLDNINNLHQIFCFEREVISKKACMFFGKQASPNGKVTKQTKPSVFVTWRNKNKTPMDADFHRDMIHNVTHLLTAVYKTWWWLYDAGFAYEGSAHWWEIYYYKKATSYCFREINSLSSWVSSKWEAKVKKAVLADKAPSITEVLNKPGGVLDAKEHVFSWSYIDYMMAMDPHKTIEFFDILKQKRPPREAFLNVWGMSVLGFEERWKEHVRTKYSLQDDNIPMSKRSRR